MVDRHFTRQMKELDISAGDIATQTIILSLYFALS